MKKITELTEQEILNLSEADIDKMIKIQMAENGYKFIEYPKERLLHEIPSPTIKVYYCNLFGTKLSFTDMNELISVLEVISHCKTMCTVDSFYELSKHNYFIKSELENANWSSDAYDSIIPITVYSHKDYLDIQEKIKENDKEIKEFNKEKEEYEAVVNESNWIKNEINNRIKDVVDKHNTLNHYTYLFKNDYLPLANGDKDIAIKFLDKAYSITDEQKEYILSNYEEL